MGISNSTRSTSAKNTAAHTGVHATDHTTSPPAALREFVMRTFENLPPNSGIFKATERVGKLQVTISTEIVPDEVEDHPPTTSREREEVDCLVDYFHDKIKPGYFAQNDVNPNTDILKSAGVSNTQWSNSQVRLASNRKKDKTRSLRVYNAGKEMVEPAAA